MSKSINIDEVFEHITQACSLFKALPNPEAQKFGEECEAEFLAAHDRLMEAVAGLRRKDDVEANRTMVEAMGNFHRIVLLVRRKMEEYVGD